VADRGCGAGPPGLSFRPTSGDPAAAPGFTRLMDLKLHRPQGACASTGRGFAAGEIFYSALVRNAGGIERLDMSAEAWQGPPEGVIAWWRSRYPMAGEAGPTLAPIDVLLDALERLEESGDDEPLRYLLALQLLRRRVLRVVEPPDAPPSTEELVLACRKRDREYRVRTVGPAEAAAQGVETRLAALLWSGDAA